MKARSFADASPSIWLFVPYAAALLNFTCKSPESTTGPTGPSSVASTEPRTPSADATSSALSPRNPPPPSTISVSPLTGAPKYPEEPCEQVASDFREFTFCWSENVSKVRDDLDAIVLAEKTRDTPLNAPLAALLRDQETWKKKRDARCDAKDNGQMGQGMGSMGSLSVARCRYDADRKRLAAFQAAREKL